jgi:hypothetical protein
VQVHAIPPSGRGRVTDAVVHPDVRVGGSREEGAAVGGRAVKHRFWKEDRGGRDRGCLRGRLRSGWRDLYMRWEVRRPTLARPYDEGGEVYRSGCMAGTLQPIERRGLICQELARERSVGTVLPWVGE